MEKDKPWYLKYRFILITCFILPPFAYLIVLLNKKKFEHKKYIEYLTLATLICCIWLLKFLPQPFGIAIIGTLFIAMMVNKYVKKK